MQIGNSSLQKSAKRAREANGSRFDEKLLQTVASQEEASKFTPDPSDKKKRDKSGGHREKGPFYLYRKRGIVTVSSDEIHLMIQSVLTATGYENAARALNEHRLNRQLKRGRIEVIDGEETAADDEDMRLCLWNKSRIVEGLIRKDKIDRHTARAIAASVEEKVLNLGMTRIRRTLIAELVLAETVAMLRVQKQLQLSVV